MYLSGLSLAVVIFNNRLIWRFVPSMESRAMHQDTILLARYNITGFFPWLTYSNATDIFETNAMLLSIYYCVLSNK